MLSLERLAEGQVVPSIEDVIIAREEKQEAADEILACVGNDVEIKLIADSIIVGECETPREMAEWTGLDIEVVYEGMRRLRRRVAQRHRTALRG
jgi:hypothetical protein